MVKRKDSVDDVYAISKIMDVVTNIDAFEDWLLSEKNLKLNDDIVNGYKLIIKTSLFSFISVMNHNSSLGLSEDNLYFRAHFKGISIFKIPNSCEKTILEKNLRLFADKIECAKTKPLLKKHLSNLTSDFVTPLKKVLTSIYFDHSKPVTKEVVDYLPLFYAYIYLVDCSMGLPQGLNMGLEYDSNFFESRSSFDTASIYGYSLSLEYLLIRLFPDVRDVISNLSNSKKWVDNNFDSNILTVDSFFSKLGDFIFKPLESKHNISIGLTKFLFLDEVDASKSFKRILSRSKKLSFSDTEYLDQFFLWYPIELLDSSRSGAFNGTPALLSNIVGLCELSKEYDSDPIEIRRIKHPVATGQFNYSYALKVGMHGTFSDASGWLLFFDCCTDYSGNGGYQHDLIEKRINHYFSLNLLEVKEMEIETNKFKDYIIKNVVSSFNSNYDVNEMYLDLSKKYLDLESLFNRTNEDFQEAKGLILELLTYYFNIKSDSVFWSKKDNGDEFDVFIEETDSIRLIECKLNPDNLKIRDEISKLKNKTLSTKHKKIKSFEFVFWYSPSEKTKRILEDKDVNYMVVSEMMKKGILLKNGAKKRLFSVFK